MAHLDKCKRTWRNSTLIPDSTHVPESDGEITIDDHTDSTFSGKHGNTGAQLLNTFCDGDSQSFSRITSKEQVDYSTGDIQTDNSEGKITYRVQGRFFRVRFIFDLAGHGQMFADSGDWTAEKPGN